MRLYGIFKYPDWTQKDDVPNQKFSKAVSK